GGVALARQSAALARGGVGARRGAAGASRRHDLLEPVEKTTRALEHHLVRRSVEQPGEQSPLRADQIADSRFDTRLAHEIVDVDRVGLTQTVDAADTLLEHGRIPGQLDVDARAGRTLEVEPNAPRVGREEDTTAGIVVEFHDVLRASLLPLLPGEERAPKPRLREQVAQLTHLRARQP